MLRFSLLAIFLGLLCNSNAQNVAPPWSNERMLAVEQLGNSFIVPEQEDIVDTADQWLKWKTVNNFAFGKNRGDLPMITDLSALHPYFRDKIIDLITTCKSKGIELAIVETYRTVAKQNEYKGMGKIYTRTTGGRSKHQYGLAIDVVPIVDSVAVWHNIALWKKIGVVGEKLGLRWGGRWRHPYDPGHFEWGGGVSGAAMERGATPKIPYPEKYPCLNEDLAILQKYWDKWEEEQKGTLVARARKAN